MSWMCPHCNTAAVIREDDQKEGDIVLQSQTGHKKYTIEGIVCPNPDCLRHVVTVRFSGLSYYKGEWIEGGGRGRYLVIPQGDVAKSRAKDYPEYIPPAVLDDYKEACGIVDLSPKASATLARRCLQGMIRDFWKVKADTLFNEVQAIEDKIDPVVWEAIDGVRKVGNIGAHMEKNINLIIDVSPEEAALLIEMIEMLLDDWYVARHEKQQKLQRIKDIAAEKTEARKGS